MKYDEKIQSLKEIFESPGEVLKRELALYRTHSGKELAEEITAVNPSLVLDLGCGSNIFKKLIPNLIGIDIADVGDVDIIGDINSLPTMFQGQCADWILCFGPLNYGEDDWVNSICSVMKYLLKPKGTIVCHTSSLEFRLRPFSKIDWTDETINRFGMIHNFKSTQQVTGYTDTFFMTDEHLKLQKQQSHRPVVKEGLESGDRMIVPLHVWRWKNDT